MKRFAIAVITMLSLGVWAGPAAAQVTFGAGAGLTVPTGDFGDVASTGWHLMGNIGFPIGDLPVRFRGDLLYGQNELEDVDGTVRFYGGLLHVVYDFKTSGKIAPYVLGGIGYFGAEEDFTDEDDTGFGLDFGAGFNFKLGSTSLFTELRYVSVSLNDLDENATFWPLTVGIRFGGK